MENLTKSILIPLDGSKNALKSLDYLDLIYRPKHNVNVTLLHVLPSLPLVLTSDETIATDLWAKRSVLERKNTLMAEKMLKDAKTVLIKKGFSEERINTVFKEKKKNTAFDICTWANRQKVDSVLLTRRGQTNLETFFMGRISGKLMNYCGDCPVWILGSGAHSKKVLVCVDSSENSLRAVDHAGFMLSGTDCHVTLFHTVRHLRRFVPMEVLEGEEELQELWKSKAGEQIEPYMEKARGMLQNAGLTKKQIAIKIVGGSRGAADDILSEARDNGYGTIALGRHGQTMIKEFVFGSVTSKVLHHCAGLAIWVVQ